MLDDKEEFNGFSSEAFLEIGEKVTSMANKYVDTQLTAFQKMHNPAMNEDMAALWKSWMTQPQELFAIQQEFWTDYTKLLSNCFNTFYGVSSTPAIEVEKGDRRFKDEDWDNNPVFDFIKQYYLLASRCILSHFAVTEGMDEATASKLQFGAKQWIDALSPTNYAMTNPQVIRKTLESNGNNLVNGFKAMLNDLERGQGEKLLTRMTDFSAFEIGKNVATTEGSVIFENDIFQLIQYTPTTKKVYETPLLIVPPWINKYYILDLREENSFIKYAVDQGHTVFVMSWINPEKEEANKTFEDYMVDGVVEALDKVKTETEASTVNTIGYCIGGTMLATTNAWLTSKRMKKINTCTFFTTLIDFSEPGDLGLFVDDTQLASLESEMEQNGYLDGTTMASVFNMLRANDLIWPFYINNYLLGEEPTAFDLLYWNSDSTRLPGPNHSFYLRNCYLENCLKDPGGVTLAGVDIDVRKIKTPSYFVSTVEDHITPWKSIFYGAKLLSSEIRFVLGGSGHIAGVINPPHKNKYFYMTNDNIDLEPEEWMDSAKQHEGSWWNDWVEWIGKQSGKKVNAREPGKKLGVLEEAPGSYVKKRIIPD